MANKESSELGNLPTSPMAKRARTCETTGERLRGPVRVPRSIGLTNRGLAYVSTIPYDMVLNSWSFYFWMICTSLTE